MELTGADIACKHSIGNKQTCKSVCHQEHSKKHLAIRGTLSSISCVWELDKVSNMSRRWEERWGPGRHGLLHVWSSIPEEACSCIQIQRARRVKLARSIPRAINASGRRLPGGKQSVSINKCHSAKVRLTFLDTCLRQRPKRAAANKDGVESVHVSSRKHYITG